MTAPRAASTRAPGSATPSGTPTILLVEDDGPIRGILSEALREDGYAVISVADGGAAIDTLRQHRPSPDALCLVILDMMLPVADGHRVLRELAGLGSYVPVLAMSADREQLARARDAGAQATLPK